MGIDVPKGLRPRHLLERLGSPRPTKRSELFKAFGIKQDQVIGDPQPLSGSLVRGTQVLLVELAEPMVFGEGPSKISSRKVVLKFESTDDPDDHLAMLREEDTVSAAGVERHAMGDHLLPARTTRMRRGRIAMAMPYFDGPSLRDALDKFSPEVIEAIQEQIIIRTVDFMSQHLVKSEADMTRMELVSMKRIERDKIWADMDLAISATAGKLEIPADVLLKGALVFTEANGATVEYSSLQAMKDAAFAFLGENPPVAAEDTNHDISMKNTLKSVTQDVDDPSQFVIIDHGYKAIKKEIVDPAEAIWVGTKAESLEALDHAGKVTAHVENRKVVVDEMDIVPKQSAVAIERYLRSLWKREGFSTKLEYPRLEEDLAMWEVISSLYEFTYAAKRVKEKLAEGKKGKGRPEAGMYMLQKAGKAFRRYEQLKAERIAKEPPPPARPRVRRSVTKPPAHDYAIIGK